MLKWESLVLNHHRGRYPRMGTLSTWCWVSFRFGHCQDLCSRERYRPHRKSPPVGNGGLQAYVRSHDRNSMERTKLLLPVRISVIQASPHIMKAHNESGSCGNVASILELGENLQQEYKVFRHAPAVRVHAMTSMNTPHIHQQDTRAIPVKRPPPQYFL